MVDVHGDGNCFFRAITHQLCYNEFHYEQIRHSAVKEVIENPERYKNFVTEGLDECIASLSRNREWANSTLLYRLKLNLIQDISTSFLVILAMLIMWQQNFKNHLLQHRGVGGFLNPQKNSSTLAL